MRIGKCGGDSQETPQMRTPRTEQSLCIVDHRNREDHELGREDVVDHRNREDHEREDIVDGRKFEHHEVGREDIVARVDVSKFASTRNMNSRLFM